MGIRESLLAILDEAPAHGYQLKSVFEARTGHVWPLNVGQVYQTLRRLERDGLVTADEDPDEGRRTYRITDAGREAARAWFRSPEVSRTLRRDELSIKLLMAIGSGSVDLRQVIQAQRTATVQTLQEYTRLKAEASPDADLPWLVVVDALILHAEADVRWLDMCEARLSHANAPSPANRAPLHDPASPQEVRR